jgi:hypothetical protein
MSAISNINSVVSSGSGEVYRSMAVSNIDLSSSTTSIGSIIGSSSSSSLETKSTNISTSTLSKAIGAASSIASHPQQQQHQQHHDEVRVGGRRDERTAKDETYLVSKSSTGFVGLNNQGKIHHTLPINNTHRQLSFVNDRNDN